MPLSYFTNTFQDTRTSVKKKKKKSSVQLVIECDSSLSHAFTITSLSGAAFYLKKKKKKRNTSADKREINLLVVMLSVI